MRSLLRATSNPPASSTPKRKPSPRSKIRLVKWGIGLALGIAGLTAAEGCSPVYGSCLAQAHEVPLPCLYPRCRELAAICRTGRGAGAGTARLACPRCRAWGADAQNLLGTMYFLGKGVSQDYTEAEKWIRRAAEQGHAYAQYALGAMYTDGKGVSQDPTEAAKWLRFAAEQGHVRAQESLGFMYHRGRGVPQDHAEAAWWFRRAAEQGDADAQFALGVMHLLGNGIPQDFAKAEKWCLRAAAQEHEHARQCVKKAMALRDRP